MKRAQAAQLFFQRECIQVNVIQEIHWGRGKNSKEVVWEECCSNLVILQLFSWENLLISSELILSWDWYLTLLHLVPARETRASSGVLRSRCLSALQELVGRNGLPLLLLSTAFKQVLHSFLYVFLSINGWML